MKSYVAHYKNKYPGAKIEFSESHLDVTDADGVLRVALRIGGGGVLLDKGEELGATDKHDLSPIPKNARVHKLFADGRLGVDDLASERRVAAKVLAEAHGGKVPSILELKKAGADFDEKENVILAAQ